jgi:hypothetical protein
MANGAVMAAQSLSAAGPATLTAQLVIDAAAFAQLIIDAAAAFASACYSSIFLFRRL